MRSKEELQKLLDITIAEYEVQFGEKWPTADMCLKLFEVLNERRGTFVRKHPIGQIPDDDLIRMIELAAAPLKIEDPDENTDEPVSGGHTSANGAKLGIVKAGPGKGSKVLG